MPGPLLNQMWPIPSTKVLPVPSHLWPYLKIQRDCLLSEKSHDLWEPLCSVAARPFERGKFGGESVKAVQTQSSSTSEAGAGYFPELLIQLLWAVYHL